MEPERSLPNSQVPAPCPIMSQLNPVHNNTSQFLKTHLIIILHLRLILPSGLFHSRFPTKTLYTPLSSPIRATCPERLVLLDFITAKFQVRIQVTKLLIMQFSPIPCYRVPLRSKYSPQHPILKHPQPMFLPQHCRAYLSKTAVLLQSPMVEAHGQIHKT